MRKDEPSFQQGMHPTCRFSGGGSASPKREQLAFPHSRPVIQVGVQREPRRLWRISVRTPRSHVKQGKTKPKQQQEESSKLVPCSLSILTQDLQTRFRVFKCTEGVLEPGLGLRSRGDGRWATRARASAPRVSPRGRQLGPPREFGPKAELGHGHHARARLPGWSVVTADKDTGTPAAPCWGPGGSELSCAGEGVRGEAV